MPTLTITSGDSASFPPTANNVLTNPVVFTAIPANSGPVRVGQNRGNGQVLSPGTPPVWDPISGTYAGINPGHCSSVRVTVPDLNSLLIFGAVGDGITYTTNG